MFITADLLMLNVADLFLFMGATGFMMLIMSIVSTGASIAFAYLPGHIMTLVFRYAVTFFFGLCLTSLERHFVTLKFSNLLRDFFLDSFGNFLECLANFFRYFFLISIRDCDIGLMTNFFVLGRTLLNFFVVAFWCGFVVNFGFVNWFIGFPVRAGFMGSVRMSYRAIRVRFS